VQSVVPAALAINDANDADVKQRNSNASMYHWERLSIRPSDVVDTAVTIWCDGLEQAWSEIQGARGARWAGVEDGGLVRCAIVIDVDLLATLGVGIRVGAVSHVNVRKGDKGLGV
jgi:hypothetical protein